MGLWLTNGREVKARYFLRKLPVGDLGQHTVLDLQKGQVAAP